jgi:carboxyl-terminal processing protease
MTNYWLQKAFSAVAAIALTCSACAQQADFNEVGRQMAIMLQNTHIARLPFNAELSQRFLADYLKDLDFQKLYFTQEDVNGFNAKYGDQLHSLLLNGTSMTPATEIYRVFEKRVEEKVALAGKLLNGPDFDFSANESVMLSRKDATWPKNDAEAAALWRLQIKEAVLGEILRRDVITKLSKEQGKPDPGAGERSPKEKVSLRYKRFLASVKDVDDEEVANSTIIFTELANNKTVEELFDNSIKFFQFSVMPFLFNKTFLELAIAKIFSLMSFFSFMLFADFKI